MTMKRRVGQILVGIYVAACVLSLLVAYFGATGLLGTAPDPLAAVFSLVLALPWTIVLSFFASPSVLASTIVLSIGMAINVALLLALLRQPRQS